jgi:hypothetical protein
LYEDRVVQYRSAPYLALNFHYGQEPEQAAFVRVIRALIDLGAALTGEALAHIGTDAREPFGFPHEWPRERIPVEPGNLDRLMRDPEMRPVSVYMFDAGGLGQPQVAEHVGYVGISRAAASVDWHPIGIDTDGAPFAPGAHPDLARHAGKKIYRRFKALIEGTEPAYAAIPASSGLKCPTDLRLSTNHRGFRDFFVSALYVGAPQMRVIRDLYDGAYMEELADGLYISCCEFFNPARTALPDDPARHAEVARIIAFAAEQP